MSRTTEEQKFWGVLLLIVVPLLLVLFGPLRGCEDGGRPDGHEQDERPYDAPYDLR